MEDCAAIKTEDDNYAPICKVIQNITVCLHIRKIGTIKYKAYIIYTHIYRYIYISVYVCVYVYMSAKQNKF